MRHFPVFFTAVCGLVVVALVVLFIGDFFQGPNAHDFYRNIAGISVGMAVAGAMWIWLTRRRVMEPVQTRKDVRRLERLMMVCLVMALACLLIELLAGVFHWQLLLFAIVAFGLKRGFRSIARSVQPATTPSR